MAGYVLLDDEQAQPTAPKQKGFVLLDDGPPQGSGSAAVDAGNAVGTGYFRGLANLAGLPVDTVANVLDLGKAALGSAYMSATGKAAPSALELTPRDQVVGSGSWLMNQARKTSLGRTVLDPVNPDYEGGYLQATGGALAGVMNPASRAEAVAQATNNIVGANVGKAVGDVTGSPELAIAASMSPAAARSGAVELAKRSIRGGEQGRQQLVRRLDELRAAGIDQPTMALATGNQTLGGVENLLQQTPGAIGIMRAARERSLAGLQDTTERAANAASVNRGSFEAGQAVQSGLKQFRDDFKARQGALYDRLDQYIPGQTPVNVEATKKTLSALNSDINGAPELSKQFQNSRIQAIERALLSDIGETANGPSTSITSPVFGRVAPAGVDMNGRPVFRGSQVNEVRGNGGLIERPAPTRVDMMGRPVPIGDPNYVRTPSEVVPVYGRVPMRTDSLGRQVPQEPVIGSRTTMINPALTSAFSGLGVQAAPANTLPFEAVKKTRSLVGNEIADTNLASSVPRSKWNPLYGALSNDMEAAAAAAGDGATRAFSRANDYTRAGLQRIDRVQPFSDATSPERAFQMLERTLGDNASTLQTVKKSLPEGARGQVAGTVIDSLGRAKPGQQNASGSAWSQETFLTNWNRMSPKARDELFSGFPNADKVKADDEAVANATSMMRDNSRMWANPSGTGANLAARGLLGLLGVGGASAAAGLLTPAVPAGAAAGLLGANLAARGLTSQNAIKSLATPTVLDPRLVDAQVRGLLGSGLLQYPQ